LGSHSNYCFFYFKLYQSSIFATAVVTAYTAGTAKHYNNKYIVHYFIQLFLQRSGIHRLDTGAFDGLKLLQELKLSDNKISTIPGSLFASLSRLTSLDLSDNFLHRVSPGTFQALSGLQWLQLRSNIFHIIPRSMFDGLAGEP